MGDDRPLHRHDPGPKLTARSTETDGWIQSFWGTILARPPNNSLQLTRLECGKLEMPCLPECAIMRPAKPEPPGSFHEKALFVNRSTWRPS
jgi:hypothetical protein